MMKSFNISLAIFISLFIFRSAEAQIMKTAIVDSTKINSDKIRYQNLDSTKIKNESIRSSKSEFILPPLETVIDSVIKRSAMVNFRNSHIGVKEATLASERIGWTDNLGVKLDADYGNINNFLTNDDSNSGNSSTLSTTQRFTYSAGFYLKIPLFDGINRKNQIKLAKLEVEEAKSMAEFQKEEIRQKVIVLYQNIILKQKLLQIKSRSFGDAKVNMQMIEKEFRNGIVTLSEYVRITGMTASMEAEYEKAMSEFITTKQLLEDMAGFVFGLTYSN